MSTVHIFRIDTYNQVTEQNLRSNTYVLSHKGNNCHIYSEYVHQIFIIFEALNLEDKEKHAVQKKSKF
jgi:hypothetical protein